MPQEHGFYEIPPVFPPEAAEGKIPDPDIQKMDGVEPFQPSHGTYGLPGNS